MAHNSDYGHSGQRLEHRRAVIIIVLAVLSLAATIQQIPSVHAAASLTIQPPSQPLAAAGSTINYNVTVQTIPNGDFAGWDLYVTVDPTIINPTLMTLCHANACNVPYSSVADGSNFIAAGTDSQCINGLSVTGSAFNNCTGLDGPGIVHDSFTSSGSTTGSLLLFTIKYTAVAGPGGTVSFPESSTGFASQNHLFDSIGNDIVASETGGVYGVPPPATSTSVNCLPSSVTVGSPTTCTATVTDTSSTPTTPGGSVSFATDSSGAFAGSPCTLSGSGSSASCQVTYTPSAVGSGTHTITGTYSGDSAHAVSSGFGTLTVTPPPLHITTTAVGCTGPVALGSPSTCTATVTDTSSTPTTPGGSVSFATDSSGAFAGSPCTLSGSGSSASCQVTYTPSAAGSGTHTITASYGGDSTHTSSNGQTALSILVTPTLGPVSLSSISVTIGQKVAISINITNNAPTVQTFTVRAKWGAITVVEQDMTLNPGERKDVALSWDTSNYSPGTANVTIVIPQSGSVQNGGPLTLNPPPSSFLSNSLLLILGAGVGVAIVVAATIIWLIRRGRTVAGTPLPSSQKGALGLSQLERIHLTSPRKTVLQKSAALIFAQWSRLKVLVGFV